MDLSLRLWAKVVICELLSILLAVELFFFVIDIIGLLLVTVEPKATGGDPSRRSLVKRAAVSIDEERRSKATRAETSSDMLCL